MASADFCMLSAASYPCAAFTPLSERSMQISPEVPQHFFPSIYLPHLSPLIPCSYWASACIAVLPSCMTTHMWFQFVRLKRFCPWLVCSHIRLPAESHLAMGTFAFGCILPATGRIQDFHPLETCAARRTVKTTGPAVWRAPLNLLFPGAYAFSPRKCSFANSISCTSSTVPRYFTGYPAQPCNGRALHVRPSPSDRDNVAAIVSEIIDDLPTPSARSSADSRRRPRGQRPGRALEDLRTFIFVEVAVDIVGVDEGDLHRNRIEKRRKLLKRESSTRHNDIAHRTCRRSLPHAPHPPRSPAPLRSRPHNPWNPDKCRATRHP